MTPSGWHDDAKNRDAGHDEMQIGVAAWLTEHGPKTLSLPKRHSRDDVVEYDLRFIGIEEPFVQDGKILAFADVLQTFVFEGPRPGQTYITEQYKFHRIFEVKPKIYSVGSLLRQCAALEVMLQHWKHDTYSSIYHDWAVYPLVNAGDEKLHLLAQTRRKFAIWDGSSLSWHRGEE